MNTILDDKRPISTIAFGPTANDAGYSVGVSGVSQIIAYAENGEMAPVAWFAVMIGNDIIARVPARMVMVVYQPPGGMQ
jgi:hypothetical protein